jgi:hypothetical protein
VILSDHFKHSLKLLTVLVALLLGGYFWLKHHILAAVTPAHVTLPAKDKELIHYNSNTHIITVTTAKGTTSTYSRNPTVEIGKNGSVKVDAHTWGFEASPFMGLAYALHGGVILGGVDVFYFKRLDLGLGLAINPTLLQGSGLFIGVGYQVYDNMSMGVGLDNHQIPMLLLEVRL